MIAAKVRVAMMRLAKVRLKALVWNCALAVTFGTLIPTLLCLATRV